MEITEYWEKYAGGVTPLAFMQQFDDDDPRAAAAEYVRTRPNLYGVVRAQNWGETFQADEQPSPAAVAAALATHLEETIEDWREPLAQGRADSLGQDAPSLPDTSANNAEEQPVPSEAHLDDEHVPY